MDEDEDNGAVDVEAHYTRDLERDVRQFKKGEIRLADIFLRHRVSHI